MVYADGSPWPPTPTAGPKAVSISSKLEVLWYCVAWRPHSCKRPREVSRQNVYLLYRSLLILDFHITRGQGRQQLPLPPAFSLPVYLPPYHLRNGPSVSPSPSLLADRKRHRNPVAKYLNIVELFHGGFDDTKSAEETR